MSPYRVESSAEIPAPAQAVYAILADYRVGHPSILPKGNTVVLESGGTGAGTVFTLTSKMLGVTKSIRMAVSEPEPGRLLIERELPDGFVTTFTVDPLRGGAASRVTISTLGPARGGVMARIEALVMPALIRRMMAHELRMLA
ncbi:MAG TPA: SRPBCC family protein, partial [Longimicrobium sp.]|nr:SRPBCC family protein [Longimicrobium sp.]